MVALTAAIAVGAGGLVGPGVESRSMHGGGFHPAGGYAPRPQTARPNYASFQNQQYSPPRHYFQPSFAHSATRPSWNAQPAYSPRPFVNNHAAAAYGPPAFSAYAQPNFVRPQYQPQYQPPAQFVSAATVPSYQTAFRPAAANITSNVANRPPLIHQWATSPALAPPVNTRPIHWVGPPGRPVLATASTATNDPRFRPGNLTSQSYRPNPTPTGVIQTSTDGNNHHPNVSHGSAIAGVSAHSPRPNLLGQSPRPSYRPQTIDSQLKLAQQQAKGGSTTVAINRPHAVTHNQVAHQHAPTYNGSTLSHPAPGFHNTNAFPPGGSTSGTKPKSTPVSHGSAVAHSAKSNAPLHASLPKKTGSASLSDSHTGGHGTQYNSSHSEAAIRQQSHVSHQSLNDHIAASNHSSSNGSSGHGATTLTHHAVVTHPQHSGNHIVTNHSAKPVTKAGSINHSTSVASNGQPGNRVGTSLMRPNHAGGTTNSTKGGTGSTSHSQTVATAGTQNKTNASTTTATSTSTKPAVVTSTTSNALAMNRAQNPANAGTTTPVSRQDPDLRTLTVNDIESGTSKLYSSATSSVSTNVVTPLKTLGGEVASATKTNAANLSNALSTGSGSSVSFNGKTVVTNGTATINQAQGKTNAAINSGKKTRITVGTTVKNGAGTLAQNTVQGTKNVVANTNGLSSGSLGQSASSISFGDLFTAFGNAFFSGGGGGIPSGDPSGAGGTPEGDPSVDGGTPSGDPSGGGFSNDDGDPSGLPPGPGGWVDPDPPPTPTPTPDPETQSGRKPQPVSGPFLIDPPSILGETQPFDQSAGLDSTLRPPDPGVPADPIADHNPSSPASAQNTFTCPDPTPYAGQVIGDGQSASLVQECAGAAPPSQWTGGGGVQGADIPPGTAIATFDSSESYPATSPDSHAAIYQSQDQNGLWVWDQGNGQPVRRRYIRFLNGAGSPADDASAYSVISAQGSDQAWPVPQP
jgi:hypothetical protein